MKESILIELAQKWEKEAIEPPCKDGSPGEEIGNAKASGRRQGYKECAAALKTLVDILGSHEPEKRLSELDSVIEAWNYQQGKINAFQSDLERFKKGYERYETVRKLTPRAYQEVWQLNVSSGKPFDVIIDELKPISNKYEIIDQMKPFESNEGKND